MSTMKFLHLQVGQQFEYRGGRYTKVAPLIASNNADGSQKMIPRSAAVTVQDGHGAPSASARSTQHPALEVMARYHATALAELQALSDDEARLGAARARLEALREELARALAERK